MEKGKIAFGIYKDRESVESAVSILKENGFRMSDISVLIPQVAREKNSQITNAPKFPEGAITGAGAGAIIGGALGLLAGAGALAIPGVGPFIVAGPIVSALAGAGVGGTFGVLGGGLIGIGIPEFEAKRYEGYIKSGGILMSVHADDDEWVTEAQRFLEATGAKNISVANEEEGDLQKNFKNSKRSFELKETKNIF